LAWSFDARKETPLPGHEARHQHCNNCPVYALDWRRRTLGAVREANAPWRRTWSSGTIRNMGDDARRRAGLVPRLFIWQPEALGRLASFEGEPWLDRQQDQRLPHGFFKALDTWLALRNAPTPEVLTIHGDQGRSYAVMTDGEILLLTSGNDPEIVELCRESLQLAP